MHVYVYVVVYVYVHLRVYMFVSGWGLKVSDPAFVLHKIRTLTSACYFKFREITCSLDATYVQWPTTMEAIDECIVAYNSAASAAEHGACQIIAASIVEYVRTLLLRTRRSIELWVVHLWHQVNM